MDWVEGVAILVAVAIVTVVGSVNDYQKELQFKKLNEKKEDRSVKLIRNGGQETLVNIADVQVGDLVLVEPGEIIPVDGIFLSGYGIKCDESSVSGESDLIKKVDYQSLVSLHGPVGPDSKTEIKLGKTDCFMISGSKVVEGYGRYLVTGVGESSFYGKIMMSLSADVFVSSNFFWSLIP